MAVFSASIKKFTTSAVVLNDTYILSAVRSPIGSPGGSLKEFTAPHLGAVAVNEALQRAAVPSDDVQNILFACALQENLNEDFARQTHTLAGLSKAVNLSSIFKCGMQSFIEASQLLLKSEQCVCVAGGMESVSSLSHIKSQDYIAFKSSKEVFNDERLTRYVIQDYEKLKKAYKKGAFLDEIIKVVFMRKGQQTIGLEDENLRNLQFAAPLADFESKQIPHLGDGAAALVLATEDYVKHNRLTPLAKVMSFANDSPSSQNFLSATIKVIEKALKKANCQREEIQQWEIDDFFFSVVSSFIKHLNIDWSLVNKDGGGYSLGYPIAMSGARVICHLVHSLPPGHLGCAVACSVSGMASAVIIKKMSKEMSRKPRLTLYTKYPCPLCEELKEQLRPFQERFSLEEVDIKAEGNKKFRKLYRYEIPVLFLNGRFLCKHNLDVEHFKRRLEIEESSDILL